MWFIRNALIVESYTWGGGLRVYGPTMIGGATTGGGQWFWILDKYISVRDTNGFLCGGLI